MVPKRYVRPLFVVTFVAFFVVKGLLRPWVLERDSSSFLVIFVNSFPNLAEAILGTIVLAGIAVALRVNFPKLLGGLEDRWLFTAVCLVAGVYVVSQELGFHDLGGRNVTDPYDVAASVIGVVLMNVLLWRHRLVTESR